MTLYSHRTQDLPNSLSIHRYRYHCFLLPLLVLLAKFPYKGLFLNRMTLPFNFLVIKSFHKDLDQYVWFTCSFSQQETGTCGLFGDRYHRRGLQEMSIVDLVFKQQQKLYVIFFGSEYISRLY